MRGLVINRFSSSGVFVGSPSGDVIAGNFIGTDPTGTAALGNSSGVFINGSNTTIGGTADGDRNVISGNSGDGVFIIGSNNVVQGNYIGTDYDRQAKAVWATASNGVTIIRPSSFNNMIGGTADGAHNLISGNLREGIFIGIGIAGNCRETMWCRAITSGPTPTARRLGQRHRTA